MDNLTYLKNTRRMFNNNLPAIKCLFFDGSTVIWKLECTCEEYNTNKNTKVCTKLGFSLFTGFSVFTLGHTECIVISLSSVCPSVRP